METLNNFDETTLKEHYELLRKEIFEILYPNDFDRSCIEAFGSPECEVLTLLLKRNAQLKIWYDRAREAHEEANVRFMKHYNKCKKE